MLWIIGLLSIFILLVSIDIFTGLWYWNRFNLSFSDTVFNNILNPIAGIISIIIYSIALFVTIRQNRLINSYSMKESFVKEIEKFKDEARNIIVELKDIYKTDFVDFRDTVDEIFMQLWANSEYIDDLKNENIEISSDDFKSKTYYPQMLFLQQLYLRHNLNHGYYSRLKQFIEVIFLSSLVENHKKKLIGEIETELLHDYLGLVSHMISYTKLFEDKKSPFLILSLNLPELRYIWTSFENTKIRDFYDWFENQKTNAYA
jgi:hypothetical protein